MFYTAVEMHQFWAIFSFFCMAYVFTWAVMGADTETYFDESQYNLHSIANTGDMPAEEREQLDCWSKCTGASQSHEDLIAGIRDARKEEKGSTTEFIWVSSYAIIASILNVIMFWAIRIFKNSPMFTLASEGFEVSEFGRITLIAFLIAQWSMVVFVSICIMSI
jgi:hypothetical protein